MITSLHAQGNCIPFCHLLIFSGLTFQKKKSVIRSECQIVQIQTRSDILSGLIWVQPFAKALATGRKTAISESIKFQRLLRKLDAIFFSFSIFSSFFCFSLHFNVTKGLLCYIYGVSINIKRLMKHSGLYVKNKIFDCFGLILYVTVPVNNFSVMLE